MRSLYAKMPVIRGWEQGRRQLPPSAKIRIRVATKYPEQVLDCAELVAEAGKVHNRK